MKIRPRSTQPLNIKENRTIKETNGQVEKADFLGEVENRTIHKEGAILALCGEKIGREMAPKMPALSVGPTFFFFTAVTVFFFFTASGVLTSLSLFVLFFFVVFSTADFRIAGFFPAAVPVFFGGIEVFAAAGILYEPLTFEIFSDLTSLFNWTDRIFRKFVGSDFE
ncbi:spermidine synthase [Striga asiatica]|uniref:Spermidine synthase n=1 Tax=Striga asiatica TaxID=4170 RepID=A0A5A7QIM2_STRAF|nr:spermidine synthase [Striga asiatica]